MDVARLPELRIDLASAASSLERAGRRLADLLRKVDDPDVPTRGLTWTIGELATHLASRSALFVGYLSGTRLPEGTVADIASNNERQIRAAADVPFATNVELLDASLRAFVDGTRGRLGDDPYPWYSGLTLDVATGTAIALAEVVVHGHDVARTVGAPWRIPAAEAIAVVKASLALAPAYLDREAARGVEVTYRLSVRGIAPVRLRIAGGELTVLPPGPEADATIRARVVPFLLVAYGRVGKWRAAVTGGLLAAGRRPWRALAFDRYFLPP
jgi:uncharacterized protein (TIGR03083 family)